MYNINLLHLCNTFTVQYNTMVWFVSHFTAGYTTLTGDTGEPGFAAATAASILSAPFINPVSVVCTLSTYFLIYFLIYIMKIIINIIS